MKKILTLLILIVLISYFSYGQNTGAFIEQIVVNKNNVNLFYYVPESYDSLQNYPLILALPRLPSNGSETPAQLNLVAKKLDAILVCPDYLKESLNWDDDLIVSAMNHAKQHYKIDNTKIIVTGYIHGAGFIFDWGVQNNNEIAGMIGYAPDLSNFNITNNLIKSIPIGLIAGSEDVWRMYPDAIADRYKKNNGKCKYLIIDGIDQMGPYYTSPEFVEDWIECYNFILNSSPSDIIENNTNDRLLIIPNPIINEAVISIRGLSGNIKITLYDYIGNKAESVFTCYNQNDLLQVRFEKGGKESGIYFLKVQTEKMTFCEKIVFIDD